MEIEVKARLARKDAMIEKLKSLGCVFSAEKTQDDTVWALKTGSLDEYLSNSAFLRIRIEDGGRVILTAKRPKGTSGNENLVKHEYETVVGSATEASNILSLMGLREAVRIIKRRQTTHCEGYEICLDDVEGLGSFVELEKIADEHGAAEIQEQMVSFLGTLGVAPEDQVKKGYDILMLEKRPERQ